MKRLLVLMLLAGSAYGQRLPFTVVVAGEGGEPSYTTVYDTVKNTNQDANSQGTANEWLEYDGENASFGEQDGEWQWGVRFKPNVPQGSTIDSFYIWFTIKSYNGWVAGDVADWCVYDVNDAPVFDASHTHALTSHETVSATKVTGWSLETGSVDVEIKSPNLASLLQVAVSKTSPAWSGGTTYVGIVLDPNTYTASHSMLIGDYDGAVTNNVARCKVVYH